MTQEAIEIGLPSVKMEWPNENKLSQYITKLEYVLLDNNYNTMHKPFCCKDYFNEIIATEIDGKVRQIYGFTSGKFPFDILKEETFKLGLIDKNKKGIFLNGYPNNILALLNQIEANRGYKLTNFEETEDNNVIVLNSDTKWMDKPAYFALYALFIRISYNYNIEKDIKSFLNTDYHDIDSSLVIGPSDSMQFRSSLPFIHYMIEGGEILQEWKDYLEGSVCTLHNGAGLNTYFSSKYSKNIDKLKYDVESSKKSGNSIQTNDIIEASNTQPVTT